MRPLRPMTTATGEPCCGDAASRGCHCDYHQGWLDALEVKEHSMSEDRPECTCRLVEGAPAFLQTVKEQLAERRFKAGAYELGVSDGGLITAYSPGGLMISVKLSADDLHDFAMSCLLGPALPLPGEQ